MSEVKNTQPYDWLWRAAVVGAVVGGMVYLTACRSSRPLETVDWVDIPRYMGKWYEIASFPAPFQKNCTCTTAEYSLNEDGTVAVFNRCYDTRKNKWVDAKAKAFVRNEETNAELGVQFFWPFRGDYFIIDVADDYSHALVGAPSREYLWILSRTPEMDPETFGKLSRIALGRGFDVSRLERTSQKNCESTP
jgi:apolipoprotein D and lipocalin family protein